MGSGRFYAIVEFEDGLQVVPHNWLSGDLMKAVWPNFTSNKRYDKAVKLMEEPEPTWLEHSIRKIYGTYFNYAVARRKLKEAEEMSDLTSNTENELYMKKSRKIRAAKTIDTSISSNEDSSADDDFLSQLPKVPKISNSGYSKIKETKNDDSYVQCTENSSNLRNFSRTVSNSETANKDMQCTGNLPNLRDNGNYSQTVSNSETSNRDLSCTTKMTNTERYTERSNNNDDDDDDGVSGLSTKKKKRI